MENQDISSGLSLIESATEKIPQMDKRSVGCLQTEKFSQKGALAQQQSTLERQQKLEIFSFFYYITNNCYIISDMIS